jgi:hypothetical protein
VRYMYASLGIPSNTKQTFILDSSSSAFSISFRNYFLTLSSGETDG